MLTLLALVTLTQASLLPATANQPAWGAPVTWTGAGAVKHAWVSPTLLAEPAPTAERAKAVLAADPSATILLEKPTMRLWTVRSPTQLQAAVPGLVPVLHELPSASSRLKVPLGAICGGQRVVLPGLAALEHVSAHPGCLPDFWYRPALR